MKLLHVAFVVSVSLTGCFAKADDFVRQVKYINRLQRDLVAGAPEAKRRIADAERLAATRIYGFTERDFEKRNNQIALATYILSGGRAGLESIMVRGETAEAKLLKMSRFFATGRIDESVSYCGEIEKDARTPRISGHVALVCGQMQLQRRREKAKQAFARARLFMPGSLVEEAAIRRELSQSDIRGDFGKVHLLAARYARLYRKSPFADKFWRELTRKLAGELSAMDPSKQDSILGIFKRGASKNGFHDVSTVARACLLGVCDSKSADRIIGHLQTIAETESERSRVELYRKFSEFEFHNESFDLNTFQADRTQPEDKQLFHILVSASDRVAPLDGPLADQNPSGGEVPLADEGVMAAVERARDLLKKVHANETYGPFGQTGRPDSVSKRR